MTIFRACYQLLSERGLVNRLELEARYQNQVDHPNVYVRAFRGNFASMNTDKGKSHGKVFINAGYNVRVWSTASEILEQNRSLFLARNHTT